ncbi:hypothetical protein DFJ63DRAFT_315374 [Scheffersomyces coipomensis]|uniref:uncharacterized protein n=1 Tax=Scheffersomyces coipomensis TaxID=1788519 RepID=UPI00315D00F8
MILSRVLPLEEDSISIETEDDSDSFNDSINDYSHLHNDTSLYQNESEFQAEINRLKTESTQRFKSKWDEILYKYSVIDDEKESDEIDLSTGLIIKDNGHLKSLQSENLAVGNVKLDGNIWHHDYDVDKQLTQTRRNELRKKKRKHALKARLKEEQKFHTVSLDNTQFNLQYDNLSNKKRIPQEDNLLQLDPSPTKKYRFTKSSSPISQDRLSYTTPTKSKTPIPTMKISPTKPSRSIHPSNVFLEDSNLHISSSTSKESSYMSPHEDETSETSQPESSQENEGNDSNSDSEFSQNEQEDTPKVFPNRISSIIDPSEDENENEDEESFDDEYSIVLDPLYFDDISNTITIYQCAFDECSYCTGNRSLYQNHLLEKHSPELHFIGYPISPVPEHIPTTIKFNESRLNKQFPLTYPIPPFPDSEDGQPLTCNKLLDNNKRCRRTFLTQSDMYNHQKEDACSHKKRVLMCPLLGCGFLTEDGYLEWRAHFIKEKHHIRPSHQELSKLEYFVSDTSHTGSSNQDIQEVIIIPDDVEDLFSGDDNNSSGFENSADEESVDEEDDRSVSDTNYQKYSSPIKREIRHVSVTEPTFTDKVTVIEDHEPTENDSLDELFD